MSTSSGICPNCGAVVDVDRPCPNCRWMRILSAGLALGLAVAVSLILALLLL
jgi:hypothetical protein